MEKQSIRKLAQTTASFGLGIFCLAFTRVLARAVHLPGLLGAVISLGVFIFFNLQGVPFLCKWSGLTLAECYVQRPTTQKMGIAAAILLPVVSVLVVLLVPGQLICHLPFQKGEFAALLSLVIDTGLGSGINEELIFRGYILKMTEKYYGRKTSLLVGSLVFGLLHLLNRPLPLTETVLFFAYTASLGILFAVMTFQSGNIWTGVLAHILVNTCGALFHFGSEAAAVSKTPGVFSYIFAEGLPVWLTGGEGAVPVFVTAAIWGLILLLARRREEVL